MNLRLIRHAAPLLLGALLLAACLPAAPANEPVATPRRPAAPRGEIDDTLDLDALLPSIAPPLSLPEPEPAPVAALHATRVTAAAPTPAPAAVTVPTLTKHSACSCSPRPNSVRRGAEASALPLVSAAPKPSACAISNRFWIAQPADTMRSCGGMSASSSRSRATASISKGARNALSRACPICSAVAWASRCASAAAKASPRRARAASGTTMKRQGSSVW